MSSANKQICALQTNKPVCLYVVIPLLYALPPIYSLAVDICHAMHLGDGDSNAPRRQREKRGPNFRSATVSSMYLAVLDTSRVVQALFGLFMPCWNSYLLWSSTWPSVNHFEDMCGRGARTCLFGVQPINTDASNR